MYYVELYTLNDHVPYIAHLMSTCSIFFPSHSRPCELSRIHFHIKQTIKSNQTHVFVRINTPLNSDRYLFAAIADISTHIYDNNSCSKNVCQSISMLMDAKSTN